MDLITEFIYTHRVLIVAIAILSLILFGIYKLIKDAPTIDDEHPENKM